MLQLAQLALDNLNKPEEKPEEKPTESTTLEDQVKELNNRITKKEHEEKQQVEKQRIFTELNAAVDNFDLFKTYPQLADGAKAEALARQSLSPRLTLKEAMASAVKDRMDLMEQVEKAHKETLKNNGLLRNSNNGILRSDGGVAAIDSDKKYTSDDVRKGASKAALTELLRAAD